MADNETEIGTRKWWRWLFAGFALWGQLANQPPGTDWKLLGKDEIAERAVSMADTLINALERAS